MLPRRKLLLTAVLLASLSALSLQLAPALAQSASDRIRLSRGAEVGEVSDMTPLEVSITKSGSSKRTVAVNEIKSIQFADEPSELTQSRLHAANGAYDKALSALEKIDVNALQRDFIRQDVEFQKAHCAAKLALSGTGAIADAGRQLNAFVRSNPNNFHYLAAVEAMGDLLMASDKYDAAQKQYAELAKAPWPEYKMRAAVAIGRTLQAQNKHPEAIEQFQTVLAMTNDSPEAQNQKLSATLGRSISLAESGSVDQAVVAIEKIIQDADPEAKELHARAYNALGNCYEKGGQTTGALLAYLHVDVLYSNVPEAHAEALAHIAPLFQAVGQEQRSREARQTLQDRYGGSRWAQ